jgi:hypothetical protein
MEFLGRWVKVGAIITLISLSVWALYWMRSSYLFILTLILEGQSRYIARQGIAFWAGVMGYHTRFLAGLIGASTIALLPSKLKESKKVNKLLALVLVLEALYFILQMPYFQYLLSFTTSRLFLAYSYIIQPVTVTPFFIIVAYKLWKHEGPLEKTNIWKWASIAFAGYIVALWSNMIMGRWFDMIATEGMIFLENITTSIGFIISTILMTLAIIFAIFSIFSIYKQRHPKALKFTGIALLLVGIQYLFHAIYSSYLGFSFDYLMLVDIWAITFLFLGIALVLNNTIHKQR